MVIIEPIKNQYLTALKERQQIIDKLNEIIRGLNALNFDDLTTIQSELVSIRESLQTQNTAITEINKSIGQIESELTSFDNRLITLNTNIENTDSHLTSFENDTALNLQSKVNKNGDTMTGNLGIPTTTTGARDNLAVNGERLQNDLDNYSSMVRTSNNQTILGIKEFEQIIMLNNFRPFIFYGNYSTSDENYDTRIRPITVFTSKNNNDTPILKIETRDRPERIDLEISITDYNNKETRQITLSHEKITHNAYLTIPYRSSNSINDYSNSEVVTIGILKQLGVIQ